MIVWKAIHIEDNFGHTASYHATKAEANKAAKMHGGDSVEKVVISGRIEAANHLNAAIKHGVSEFYNAD